MRNPKRLDKFYEELKDIHKEKFPDWRFGQLIMNWFSFYVNKYRRDIFYVEENEAIESIKEYVKDELKGSIDNE